LSIRYWLKASVVATLIVDDCCCGSKLRRRLVLAHIVSLDSKRIDHGTIA
jgi:hypothetical protein